MWADLAPRPAVAGVAAVGAAVASVAVASVAVASSPWGGRLAHGLSATTHQEVPKRTHQEVRGGRQTMVVAWAARTSWA